MKTWARQMNISAQEAAGSEDRRILKLEKQAALGVELAKLFKDEQNACLCHWCQKAREILSLEDKP